MIKKLFSKRTASLSSAAFLIGLLGLISRLLGVVRTRIFSEKFGAGEEIDMFMAAFRLPDLIFNILVFGAVSSAFIPVFSQYLYTKKSKGSAWALANQVMTSLVVGLGMISVILVIFAPWLVKAIAPGFNQDQLAMTTLLTRIMLIQPIVLALSNVISGILQTFRVFFAYASAPVFYNIGIIAGALFFTPRLGVVGLAWGVVLAAALHLGVQLPALRWLKFSFRPRLAFDHPGLKRVIFLMLPRALGLAVLQLNTIVITAIASTLSVGSIAVFTYANDIQYAPLGIIGIAFAIAAFPALSEHFVRHQSREFNKALGRAAAQILFVITPLAALFFVLKTEIVTVILRTSRFGAEEIELTARTLSLFAISIPLQGLIPLFSKAFYALQNTMTPVVIGVVGMMVNLIISLLLAPKMGVPGLALSFSISSIIIFVLLLAKFKKTLTGFKVTPLIKSFLKIIIASIGLISATHYTLLLLTLKINQENNLLVFLTGMMAGTVGLGAYLALSWAFRLQEFHEFSIWLLHPLKKRLK